MFRQYAVIETGPDQTWFRHVWWYQSRESAEAGAIAYRLKYPRSNFIVQ